MGARRDLLRGVGRRRLATRHAIRDSTSARQKLFPRWASRFHLAAKRLRTTLQVYDSVLGREAIRDHCEWPP